MFDDMFDKILEEIIAGIVASLLLTIAGSLLGIINVGTSGLMVLFAILVVVVLIIGLWGRHRIQDLRNQISNIRYSEYFPDEASACPTLKRLISVAPRLRIVSLANTNVFHMFEEYRDFLVKGKSIEVLCLDPQCSAILESLDRLVAIAAQKKVLPELAQLLETLPISDEIKQEARNLIHGSGSILPTKTMIQVSLLIWQAVREEAEKLSVNGSRFLTIRLYQCPPTVKGWVIGDDIVLRGDFSIPGYGLAAPQILFSSEHALNEVRNFILAFQLLWTDEQTNTSCAEDNGSTRPEAHVSTRATLSHWEDEFDFLAGNFYESSGKSCVQKALESLSIAPNASVVDLGAGTGYFSFLLARKLSKNGHVLAVDNNLRLMQSLERYIGSVQWPGDGYGQIEPMTADVHRLKLPRSSVGCVFCRHSLHHFNDPQEALKRILSWLTDDGVFILIEVVSPDEESLCKFINQVAKLSNPENVRYYKFSELMQFLRHFEIEISPFFARDYRIPIRDYYRRCRTPEDHERLDQLIALLKSADNQQKEHFQITGDDVDNLCITLPEVLVISKKRVKGQSWSHKSK